MRSDRELLELAAKAAGYEFHWRGLNGVLPAIGSGQNQKWWNPLTDDGDALRLAVKLGIQVTPPSDQYPYAFAMEPTMQRAATREDNVADPYAATRRAIVRAAAEIGAQAHPDNKDGGANA